MHEAVVVVGVLADQVDPPRRRPDTGGGVGRPGPCRPGYGVDVGESGCCESMGAHCSECAAVAARRYGGDMLAAYAVAADAQDPLSALRVGEIDPPSVPAGWVEVRVRAAALNHHDVWSLRGVGLPAERLPMVLGCDAAGVTTDGREVVVHAVINDPAYAGADETYDPRRSLLSERYPGTLAESSGCPPATSWTSRPH